MKYAKSLILIFVVVWSQNIEASNKYRETNFMQDVLPETPTVLFRENHDRGFKDIWEKIKENAIKSWNYIKDIAAKTKEKIENWIEEVKNDIEALKKEFENKLNELKDKVQDIINEIYGTGELVKECLMKEQQNIEGVLKEIMQQMAKCVAEQLKHVSLIGQAQGRITLNDTLFLEELDDKLKLCEQDIDNVEECLNGVREDVFDNFNEIETNIMENHMLARSIVDDIKGSVVSCSVEYLSNATYLISEEIVQISKCVVEAKENENSNANPSKE